jgi:autotransporter-associated beta strand protein
MNIKKHVILTSLVLMTLNLYSITSTWTGAVNNSWSAPGNWDNGVPIAVSDVANFTGTYSSGTTNMVTLDVPVSLGTLNLNPAAAPGLVLSGNSLTLNSAFNATTSINQTINCPLVFGNTVTFTGNDNRITFGPTADFSGAGGYSLQNFLVMQLDNGPNNYSGTTTVATGRLNLNCPTGPCIPGNLIISMSGEVVEGTHSGQFSPTSIITVDGATSVLDFNNNTETIGGLTLLNGATVLNSDNVTISTAVQPVRIGGTAGDIALARKPAPGRDPDIEFIGIDSKMRKLYMAENKRKIAVKKSVSTLFEATLNDSIGTIEGVISSDPGSGIVCQGPGTLVFAGAGSNTYDGDTEIQGGALKLSQSGGVAIPGDAFINGGTLVHTSSNQMATMANVTLSSGAWDLGGNTESINSFTFEGGSLAGNGGITLNQLDAPHTVGVAAHALVLKKTASIYGPIYLNGSGTQVVQYTRNVATTNEQKTLTRLNPATGYIDIIHLGTGSARVYKIDRSGYEATELAATSSSQDVDLEINNGTGTTGMISQIGGGTLAFTGTHNYPSADYQLEDGTLFVNGDLTAATMKTLQGTKLKGKGIIHSPCLIQGTLKPGASIGTLTFIGNQVLDATSTLEIEVDPTSADLVDIQSGNLTINPGATLAIEPLPGTYPSSGISFPIIQTTGGVSGTFTNVTTSNSLFFQAFPLYTADSVSLQLNVVNFAQLPVTGNAKQVAVYLGAQNPSPGSDFATVYSQLMAATSIDQLQAELNQLHAAPLKGLVLTQETEAVRVRSSITTRMREFDAPNCVNICQNTHVWLDFQGSIYRQSSYHDQNGFKSDGGSATLGVDYQRCNDFLVGAAVAYSYEKVEFRRIHDKGQVQSAYGSLYASWDYGHFFMNTVALGAGNWYKEERRIEFADINRRPHATFGGWEALGHLDLGVHFGDRYQYAPFVGVDYIYLHQNQFKEKGADSLNLTVHASNNQLVRTEAGIFFDQCFSASDGRFMLEEKISYIREERFGGEHYTSTMEGGNAGTFTVTGLSPSRNLVSPAITLFFTPTAKNYSVWLKYEGEWGLHYNQQNVHLGFLF